MRWRKGQKKLPRAMKRKRTGLEGNRGRDTNYIRTTKRRFGVLILGEVTLEWGVSIVDGKDSCVNI